MPKDFFTIDSVLGQDKAKAMLRRAVQGKRLAHAYLFRGPAGVGKKTLARAFGNYLNCLAPTPTADACGHCPSCRKLQGDNHPDRLVIAPEGAAIKIDQIRELKRALTFPPFEASLRTVLLCDVHTMRRSAAANSLLKLLEEPPPGNLLILTGDAASEILPTITSRCQQIPFTTLPLAQVAAALTAESRARETAAFAKSTSKGLEPARQEIITPTTAATLAALADGSLGQARRLAASPLLELRRQIITSLLQLHPGRPETAEAILALADSSSESSEHLSELLGLLQLWFRDIFLLHQGQPQRVVNLDLREALEQALRRWPLAELPQRLALFEKAKNQLARNCNRALVCEVLYFGLL
ncbi:MAG: DNA polymerase III subunit delta' [Desulfobulbaceae bacterium]|nr:DNA polymerase III subunit delta' [Desulfobulbaceae bacterium]